MAANRMNVKLDELLDDLSLTVEEREYIHVRWRLDRRARRVINLLQEAVGCRSFGERKPVLEQLVAAVQELRAQIQAERTLTPEGYVLVAEEALEALTELAVVAVQVQAARRDADRRQWLLDRLFRCVPQVLSLCPQVAAEAGAGGDDGEEGEAA